MNKANSTELICCVCALELAVGEEYLQCMVKTCGKLFHRSCNNKVLTLDEIDTWACSECRENLNKGGPNSDTPFGTPVSIKNVANRSKCTTPIPPTQPGSSSNITLEIQLMRDQMNMLSEQLFDAVSTISRFQSALSECAAKFEVVNNKLLTLESVASRQCNCKCVQPSTSIQVVGIEPKRRSQRKKSRRAHGPVEDPNATVIEVPAGEVPQNVMSTAAPPASPICSSNFALESSNVANNERQDAPEGEFIKVTRRKRQYSSVRCTAAPDATPLRAVEYRKYIHLWNMASGVEDVRAFLQSLCPNTTCTVDELKPKGEYKSFKIGVPPALFETCLSADLWPDNARVRPWLFRKRQVHGSRGSQPQ